ncbi:hypothetical protein [Stigmatella aurantiaca]|uniref:Uncharacterized protein n=1 Tax=Stigmatella aurantiaca (strain DW4/3-1) TaxID=378806 RepID=Q08YC7_STIAD|nr:hypothetical protein [Stigmatella aurantiaca]EAU65505.1 hypothetical protein STIAU_1214 [Stigmatella aurantiaca DW4/3-1]
MAGLRDEAESDPALAEALSSVQRELSLYERSGSGYGCVFYLLRVS